MFCLALEDSLNILKKECWPMTRKTRFFTVVPLVLAIALTLSGCTVGPGPRGGVTPVASDVPPGWGRGRMMSRGMGPHGRGRMMGGAMQRHRWAMMGGTPEAYRGLQNPLPSDPETIAAGRALYQTHCAACHGEQGLGDGPAAAGLSPPPANLRWTLARPMTSDGYLMWTISKGGPALGMPSFQDALGEVDRWKIIRFLRTI